MYQRGKEHIFFQGAFQIALIGEFEFMDLLYSKYASPIEFMNLYINNGQFGEFVENIISKENKRRQEEAEKDNEQKLWTLYVHSMTDKSFNDWKAQVLQSSGNASIGKDADLTDSDIDKIMKKLFPE